MAQQAQMQAAEKFKAAEATAHNPPGEAAINPAAAEESEDEEVKDLVVAFTNRSCFFRLIVCCIFLSGERRGC